MKKFIPLLFLSMLFLMSCPNDDDSILLPQPQDQIIGTWTRHKSFTNGVEEPLTECEQQSSISFLQDGVLELSIYDGDFSGNCELDEMYTGTWLNEGNGFYSIDTGEGPTSEMITFVNNTFYVDDEDGTDTYREVYIRQ